VLASTSYAFGPGGFVFRNVPPDQRNADAYAACEPEKDAIRKVPAFPPAPD